MRRRARDHGFHRFEWTHQRADGSTVPVEATLTPVRLNGREVILAVWHDIAEQKRDDVVGTIAGEDTIFVVARTTDEGEALMEELHALMLLEVATHRGAVAVGLIDIAVVGRRDRPGDAFLDSWATQARDRRVAIFMRDEGEVAAQA